ncbi:MAG: hypothetical protein ABJH45_13825 [Paracoccaceae bacterium]
MALSDDRGDLPKIIWWITGLALAKVIVETLVEIAGREKTCL